MEETSTPRAQWLRGVLDMCLLALMAEEPVYGYEMTVRLAKAGLDVADGSIYPALARLRKRQLVEVERRHGGGGPARTYYRPSEAGMRMLQSWSRDWSEFATNIGSLITRAAREDS
ncbi:PadR family transcriptional regulator [Streptomyces yunnanensis]|uniref:PadR family transcriptional regulator, regulatory protein PadR n=1 Tax=Streptomyces yunnanensis TaxID=156453 RepID=A0A9X8QWQ7_9ACTN|nr:PadR family transcriptional regulator [Streptomyces yunnanensis]SHM69956.1 PadR family transcriptional regulator, regulatory protein PadR [Streptomyces yunnanensis]